jgi:hypothetical protein
VLKVSLGADQSRLTLLGVACDVGENLGLLLGVLCNRLHPALILTGAGACLLEYGTVWLLVFDVAPVLPYWMLQEAGEGRSSVRSHPANEFPAPLSHR